MEECLRQPRYVQSLEGRSYPCPFYLGFTRRIIGVPKAESDAILQFLFRQISENHDQQVRFHWEPNSIAFWDNRVCGPASLSLFAMSHGFRVAGCNTFRHVRLLASPKARFFSSIQYKPTKVLVRHALRVTPHAERPLSVEEFEKQTGRVAKDRQIEVWKQQGLLEAPSVNGEKNHSKPRGYND